MARQRIPGQRHSVSRGAGFTLVELIVTLVLIAVVAVTAASRFQDDTGYTEFTLQQRLISALRQMQTRAMQDTRPGFCYRLILNTGTPAAFGPSSADYSAGNENATCTTTIDTAAPDYLQASSAQITAKGVSFTATEGFNRTVTYIGFDNLGNPLTNNIVFNRPLNCRNVACRMTFTGEESAAVCVEREGYIHAC
ncbi:type II secretion system protein [Alteromonas antoniana]|uniref:type II secretion system protein n=1 Tax=Alteromonas antoniana TaxID=2803813 RepID=UPI001C441673|nr:prepilin-type N-terminal cleavage/methylation domain-containing protein [Alteromonas antoniana]